MWVLLWLRRSLTILMSMPALERERRPGVTEAVQGDRREFSPSGVIPVEVVLLAVELPGEPLGVVRPAVELAEHVALVVVPGTEAELRLGLFELVRA